LVIQEAVDQARERVVLLAEEEVDGLRRAAGFEGRGDAALEAAEGVEDAGEGVGEGLGLGGAEGAAGIRWEATFASSW
jgi:hypothetical protein